MGLTLPVVFGQCVRLALRIIHLHGILAEINFEQLVGNSDFTRIVQGPTIGHTFIVCAECELVITAIVSEGEFIVIVGERAVLSNRDVYHTSVGIPFGRRHFPVTNLIAIGLNNSDHRIFNDFLTLVVHRICGGAFANRNRKRISLVGRFYFIGFRRRRQNCRQQNPGKHK